MPTGSSEAAGGGQRPWRALRVPAVRLDARRRRWLALGVAAYLVALLVTFPARFVLPAASGWAVSGTVWNGAAVMGGAYRLEWRWAPWRSLASLGFAADVRVTGSGTDLAGSAVVRPGETVLDGLAGRADGAMLATLAPNLPFACDAGLQLNFSRILMAGARSEAEGQVHADPGTCRPSSGGDPAPMPALLAQVSRVAAGTTRIDVTPARQPARHLVDAGIAAGRLHLALTPAGAALLPFARGAAIDMPL